MLLTFLSSPIPLPLNGANFRAVAKRPLWASNLQTPVTFDPSKSVSVFASRSLGDSGTLTLAHQISQAPIPPQTTLLTLDSNQINDKGAIALAEHALPNLPHLEELLLWDNNISDAGATAIAKALANPNSNTRVLNLAKNKIGSSGGSALGACLKSNRSLETIYLMGMGIKGGGIGDRGAESWVEGLRENTKGGGRFWFVNMKDNGVSEECMKRIKEGGTGKERLVVYPLDPYPGYKPRRGN